MELIIPIWLWVLEYLKSELTPDRCLNWHYQIDCQNGHLIYLWYEVNFCHLRINLNFCIILKFWKFFRMNLIFCHFIFLFCHAKEKHHEKRDKSNGHCPKKNYWQNDPKVDQHGPQPKNSNVEIITLELRDFLRVIGFIKWNESSRWSFGPNPAWCSIEKAHPTLPMMT